METEELRSQFAAFLADCYPDKVKEFAEQYPGSYSFPIRWSALETYDPELALQIEKNLAEIQTVINDALRYHDLHDATYLNYASVVFSEPPEWKYPNEIRHSHRGILCGIQGRVSNVDEPETVLRDAVFECRDCGSRNIKTQEGDELIEPYECTECEKKRVEYDLKMEKSTTESQQQLVVEDPQSLKSGGHTVTIDVEIIGDATGTLTVGDWARLTGQVKYKRIGNTTEIEPYFEATYAEITEPEQVVVDDINHPSPVESAFIATSDVKLTKKHLTAFAQHVENVLEECSAREMTEAEGKLKFITPFIELLGWDLFANEVRMEYSTYQGDVDYAILVDEEPLFCVEAKSPGTLVPSHFEQLRDYMLTVQADWGLLSDGITYQLIRNNRTRSSPTIIVDTSYEVLDEYYDEFSNITKDAIIN